MMTDAIVSLLRHRTVQALACAGIALSHEETSSIEVLDFGYGRPEMLGLQLLVYINNDRYCAKELVLFPFQTCAEHRHPGDRGRSGKQETFRCRAGMVYLYLPGNRKDPISAMLHEPFDQYLLCREEIILHPGEQYTIPPDTWHWFQAGPEGAIISEFSSASTDESDVFRDPAIRREPVVMPT